MLATLNPVLSRNHQPPTPTGSAVARVVGDLRDARRTPNQPVALAHGLPPARSSTGGALRVALGMLDPGGGTTTAVSVEYDPATNALTLVFVDQFHTFTLAAAPHGLRGELSDNVGWAASQVTYYALRSN